MSMFEDQPARPTRNGADWEHHRAHREVHAGPPRDEVGIQASPSFILARSSDVVVALRGITAFSDGLLLQVVVLFSDEQRREEIDGSLQEYGRSLGRFRFGVVLNDGTSATTGTRDAPDVMRPGSAPSLTLQRSRGGVLDWMGDYWLWPLPQPGRMVLGCRWPDRAIPETLLTIDPAPLLKAAKNSKPVWPSS